MLKPKAELPAKGAPLSGRDQTWRYYSEVMDKFRKMCHSDKALFEQAENRIKAKRVVAAYESQPNKAVDPFSLAKNMTDYVMDLEDEKQVDELYRAKLAFRDRVCNLLGKLPEESWDAFFDRCSSSKRVPHAVKMFEMAKQPP